nr:hypothetical protein [Pandoravirus aubagnensis]
MIWDDVFGVDDQSLFVKTNTQSKRKPAPFAVQQSGRRKEFLEKRLRFDKCSLWRGSTQCARLSFWSLCLFFPGVPPSRFFLQSTGYMPYVMHFFLELPQRPWTNGPLFQKGQPNISRARVSAFFPLPPDWVDKMCDQTCPTPSPKQRLFRAGQEKK